MPADASRRRPRREPAPLRVAIRGRGRAGKALARAFAAAGIRVRWLPSRSPARSPEPVDVVVLAVPDDAIAPESARLASSGLRPRLALHLSGALPADVAAAWRSTGAAVVSFHPLGSFAGRAGETAAGRAIAIEGDRRGIREAERLARAIGGRPWRIDPKRKALYHAAATAAAGGTATLVAEAARAAESAGMPAAEARRAFATLAGEAAGNVRRLGFPEGLTGPLARGDAGTLSLHRRALAGRRGLAAAYAALAGAARAAVRRRKERRDPASGGGP